MRQYNPFTIIKLKQPTIKKQGFYVWRYLTIWKFLLDGLFMIFISFGIWGISYCLLWVFSSQSEFLASIFFEYKNYIVYLAMLTPIGMIIQYIYGYLFLGNFFFFKDKIIAYGRIYDKDDKLKEIIYVRIFRMYIFKIWQKGDNRPDVNVIQQTVSSIMVYGSIITIMQVLEDILSFIVPFTLITILIVISIYFLAKITEHFHSLYAFGNLGSKIQSLTPRIPMTSTKIEKEFSSDMNFRVLSDSFDTLSQDFSQISQYVLRLESIEKKANKGNLFDSEKYIGSLQEDIVKPLIALRLFLEKKKTELESSRTELQQLQEHTQIRVQSGSGSGQRENIELQSKRSIPLIQELTENIEKLSGMIEKFGRI